MASSQPHIIEVVWLDSGMHVDHGWAPIEKYLENTDLGRLTVRTVGLLMHKNADHIMVALSYDEAHETWYGAQFIARQNVISTREWPNG